MPAKLVRMFTNEEAAAVIGDALEVYRSLDVPEEIAPQVFGAVVGVVGQHTIEQPSIAGVSGGFLPRN